MKVIFSISLYLMDFPIFVSMYRTVQWSHRVGLFDKMNGKSPIVRCLARLKIFCSSLLSVIICGSGLKMLIADRPSHKPSYSVAACCLEIKSLIHTKTAADSQDTSIILIGLHADKYFEIHLKLQDILLSFFRNFILYFY